MKTATNRWFEVDKEGLSKLIERRGKAFVIFELVQNAWDSPGATRVEVELTYLGYNKVRLVVTDDSPKGFSDLRHAFTLFAPSAKKGDPSLRGRFNFGEKLVLAICDRATVTSTTGQVAFESDGTRKRTRARTKSGTIFEATVRMTRGEMDEALIQARKLLAPVDVVTVVNDKTLERRHPDRSLAEVFLLTDVAGPDGVLKRRYNMAVVELHVVSRGERATLYELGIPVVELGDDPFHINVKQKVPLSLERDGVPPAYLRDLRGAVLDQARELISETAAAGKWTQDAIEGSEDPSAVKELIAKRFGQAVIADPSDVEGTKLAASRGYTVIPGGAFTSDAWDKIRKAGVRPAGQVTPSPRPFHPDGAPLVYITDVDYQAMRLAANTLHMAGEYAGVEVTVLFTKTPGWNFRAAYGKTSEKTGIVTYNLALLDEAFWESPARQFELIVHELGHHAGGHLDEAYHKEICRIAGRAIAAAQETGAWAVAGAGETE